MTHLYICIFFSILWISEWTTYYTLAASDGCITSDRVYSQITAGESNVTNVDVTRRYVICDNSYVKVKSYNGATKTFYGTGVPALTIYQPNVEICCGSSCSLNNNCTFAAGTFHVRLMSGNLVNSSYKKYELTNILIQGFKFTGASEANIKILGVLTTKSVGAELTVRDCSFHENSPVANIWFYNETKVKVAVTTVLTVENSIFRDNRLLQLKNATDSGLIASENGGKVIVRNTKFLNNYIGVQEGVLLAGLRAYINVYDASYTFTDNPSTIEVYDSTFIQNEGHTYALVVGGLFGDGVLKGSGNTYFNNTAYFPRNGNICNGMSRLIQDYYYYPDYYTYYYYPDDAPCIVPFQELKPPTARPTKKPTKKPTRKPTRKPTNPTQRPSKKPTKQPSKPPTRKPSTVPTRKPTKKPTKVPTRKPTKMPTRNPTRKQSKAPTRKPTRKPTKKPTRKPTKKPTQKPTKKPTQKPSKKPTQKPSKKPTRKPSKKPTRKPSKKPTRKPSKKPTRAPA